MTPLCTVLIPTYNRRDTLLRCLEHLAASDVGVGSLQVIVVDDGSSDGTADAARACRHDFADLVVRSQDNAGPGAARNLGLGDARAPITLFINDDTLVFPGTVRAHLDAHARHPRSIVLGTFEFVPEFAETPLGRLLTETPHLFPYPLFDDGDELAADLCATCNLSVPTAAAQQVGFDPRFTFAAEDVDFGLRLQDERGFTLRHCAAARALHDHHLTVAGLERTAVLRGFAAARLALKWGRYEDLVSRATDAFLEQDGLRELLDASARSLEHELDEAAAGARVSVEAYEALARIFRIGNVLGYLDEPTLMAMTKRALAPA